MLTPIEQQPGRDAMHTRLVHESFSRVHAAHVITVVASLSHMDRDDPERISEWRAYWIATSLPDQRDRIEACADRGTKLSEEVARAMFPSVEGWYNR